MPLVAAKPKLEQAILTALTMASKTSSDDKGVKIRADLAKALATAIDDYVKSAQVNITAVVSTVPPGVSVATVGSPAAQTGATVAPGIAQHTGFGTLQ